MNRGRSAWLPQAILLVILYAIACVIEPCDGHSCNAPAASEVRP